MRFWVTILALVVISACFSTPVRPDSDDNQTLAGNQAEVPTWLVGDWWEYELTGAFADPDINFVGSGSMRFEVSELITENVGGKDYLLYNLTISGDFTGSGSGTVQGIDVDIDITTGTLGGYWWVERGDLAVLRDNQTVQGSGTVTAFGLPFPLVMRAAIMNTYTPSREDYDFPIEVGDQWQLDTNMEMKGFIYFFADIPLFPIEQTIPIDTTSLLVGTASCNQQLVITVPAGSFDSFEVSLSGTGSDERWFSETVGNMVRWEHHEAGGLFGDLYINLTSYSGAAPIITVDEYLFPEKVNAGGNVTVSGTSSAISSEVTIIIPATGATWPTTTNATGAYSLNITAPTIPDNTPTLTDIGSHGVLVEVTESVNTGYAVRTLTIVQPDLGISNVSLLPPPVHGSLTSISADVHCGPEVGVSNEILVTFYADGQVLGNSTIPYMDAGSTTRVSQQWLSAMGIHNITVFVDPLDSIDEHNETNNSITVQITVPGPDLTPTGIGVENGLSYFYPDGEGTGYVSDVIDVFAGTSVNISTNVTNVGISFTVEEFTVEIYETNGFKGPQLGPSIYVSIPLSPLGGGESHGPFRVMWNVPLTEGMHYVNITVDAYNNLTELIEQNNTFILRFSVRILLPDLYIGTDDISFSSQPLLGSSITIYADVHAGLAKSVNNPFKVSFYVDGQPIGNDTISPPLAAGETANASQIWTADVDAHTITVVVDSLDDVNESDELNNTAQSVVIVPRPDLSPRDIVVKDSFIYVYQDPESVGYVSDVIVAYSGQTLDLSLSVSNFGASFFNTDFRVQFNETNGLGGPPLGPAFYDSGLVPSILAGQSRGPLSSQWDVPFPPGNYFINMTVDTDQSIPETDENNNTFIVRIRALAPTDPDYVPVTNLSSLVKIPIGSQVYLHSKVENIGMTLPSSISTIAFYDRSDPTTPIFERSVNPLSGGETSSMEYGFNWTPPSAGTFVIVIEVDYYGNITEMNELNNNVSVTVVVSYLPTTVINVGSPNCGADPVYVTSSTPFELTATDHSGEGIKNIFYKVDTSSWHDYLQTGAFTVFGEGTHTIAFYSIDNVNGTEPENSITIYVDEIPPITNLLFDGPDVTPSTEITLSASDDGSGVASTWYSIDNGTLTEYTGPFTLEAGSHRIEYHGIDNLENAEHPKFLDFSVVHHEAVVEGNYKPILSLVLAIVLIIFGLLLNLRKEESDQKSEKKNLKDRLDMKSFIIFSLSFAVVEIIIGVASATTGALSIPPVVGEGMIIDLLIFISGLVATLLSSRKGRERID
ncbi:MAG: hypothetical protein E3J35_00555 [Methanomassiliicoccales archaeon]|nr:MAG: hypothetical protein E3J35_00555 [Methanomassiliicoccales archaeon]